MILDERIGTEGALERCRLERSGDQLSLVDEPATPVAVSEKMVVAVMRRYARELDEDAAAGCAPELELAGGLALGPLRFHARVDADARDYVVLFEDGQPPRAALGRDVAAALRHLLRAYSSTQ